MYGRFGRGTEPEVVVEPGRRLAVGRRAEAGHDVAVGPHPDRDDLADVAALDQLARLLVVRPRPLLGADLDDPLVPPGDVDHPPPLADEQAQRLLDVHVLARRAGHHGHQGVPVVGRRDDHRVDVAVVEQGRGSRRNSRAEPPISATASSRRPRWTSAMATMLGVGLIAEVEDVPLADQAEADEAQADPIVGPQDPPIARGRQGGGGTPSEKSSPVRVGVNRQFRASSRSSSLEIVGSLQRSRSGPGGMWSRPSFWPAGRADASHRSS